MVHTQTEHCTVSLLFQAVRADAEETWAATRTVNPWSTWSTGRTATVTATASWTKTGTRERTRAVVWSNPNTGALACSPDPRFPLPALANSAKEANKPRLLRLFGVTTNEKERIENHTVLQNSQKKNTFNK